MILIGHSGILVVAILLNLSPVFRLDGALCANPS